VGWLGFGGFFGFGLGLFFFVFSFQWTELLYELCPSEPAMVELACSSWAHGANCRKTLRGLTEL